MFKSSRPDHLEKRSCLEDHFPAAFFGQNRLHSVGKRPLAVITLHSNLALTLMPILTVFFIFDWISLEINYAIACSPYHNTI